MLIQTLMPDGTVARVMLRVRVRAPLRPTEDAEKVKRAILNLFPDAQLRVDAREVVADAPSLDRLRELVRSERIPDTARGVMLHGMSLDGAYARFLLGKQAAAAGRAHFGAIRGPLGDLEVELSGDPGEVERAIYRVAHDTTVPPEWAEVPPSERPQP